MFYSVKFPFFKCIIDEIHFATSKRRSALLLLHKICHNPHLKDELLSEPSYTSRPTNHVLKLTSLFLMLTCLLIDLCGSEHCLGWLPSSPNSWWARLLFWDCCLMTALQELCAIASVQMQCSNNVMFSAMFIGAHGMIVVPLIMPHTYVMYEFISTDIAKECMH